MNEEIIPNISLKYIVPYEIAIVELKLCDKL